MHNLCSHLPLSALLPNATVKSLSDLAPVLGSVLLHILYEGPVFFLSPGTFDHLRVEDLLPAVEALDVSSFVQSLSNTLPILGLNNQVRSEMYTKWWFESTYAHAVY